MKYNHFSVLEEEVLSYVDDTKPSIILDATLGLGGHTLSIFCLLYTSDAADE